MAWVDMDVAPISKSENNEYSWEYVESLTAPGTGATTCAIAFSGHYYA